MDIVQCFGFYMYVFACTQRCDNIIQNIQFVRHVIDKGTRIG